MGNEASQIGDKLKLGQLGSLYGVSKKKAAEGVWVTPSLMVGEKNPKRFKLARMSKHNNKYQAALNQYSIENRRRIQAGLISPAERTRVALKIFCETILLDWENFFGLDGQPVPYSPELGMALMEELDDLYEELSEKASEIAAFQIDEDKKVLGE